MMDFRKVERHLAEYFRARGVAPTEVDGDLYLGVVETQSHREPTADGLGTQAYALVPKQPTMEIVSLTKLAEEIAELK